MDLKKYLNAESLLIYFLLFALLPFLILTLFAHPSLDDFAFSELVHDFGFLGSQHSWYFTWTGRFFSSAFLSSFNPLIYKSIAGLKILFLIFIIVFVYIIYFLISELSDDKLSKKQKLLISLSFCLMYLIGVPASKYVLYWLASVGIYQLANILMIFLFALMLKLFKPVNKNHDSLLTVCCCFLIAAVCGSNEISMAMLTVFLFLLLVVNLIIQKSINKKLLLFLVISIISSFISYMSPANRSRLAEDPESSRLMHSILHTITDTAAYLTYKNLSIPFVSFTIIFIIFLLKYDFDNLYRAKLFSVSPLYSISIFILTLASGFFASYMSTGRTPFQRRMNVVYFVFLLGWFVNIAIIVCALKRKHNLRIKFLPDYYYYAILCILLTVSIVFFKNSVRTGYSDLLRGTAYRFDLQLNERYDYIKADKSDTCFVNTIKDVPVSYFFDDIKEDPNFMYNIFEAKYFGKKILICKDTIINAR